MSKFRKKPIVIEAMQVPMSVYPQHLTDELSKFMNAKDGRSWYGKPNGDIVIHTLEGDMTAQPGDWIIRGIKGELYPCKPDIFEATYEPVNGE